MSIVEFLRSLQEVAHQADEQRLSLLIDQFEEEYPDLSAQIRICAQMPDAKSVLSHLSKINQNFALLNFVPDIENVITFLQKNIKQRSAQLNDK